MQRNAELKRGTTPRNTAEYTRWVRAKVQASRADPHPAITEGEWQSIRAAKLAARTA